MSDKNHTLIDQSLDEISSVLKGRKYSKQVFTAHNHFDSVVKLVPDNPRASSIELAQMGDLGIRFFAGKATAVELYINNKSPAVSVLNTLRELVEGVVEGKFIESVWLSGTKVTRYYSELKLSNKLMSFRDCNLPAYLFLRSTKQTSNYEEWSRIES